MSYLVRKKQILNILKELDGRCSIDLLCNRIFCSKSTIRRDLLNLEEEGIITRHHGGVILIKHSASEYSENLRKLENQEKKYIIAKLAKKYITDNMVLFFDSSSTVTYLIPIIKEFSNMTVITNGINVAEKLTTKPDLKCYICPGMLKSKCLSIIGEYTSEFLKNFQAQIAFISCKAINKNGIFEGDDVQALNKKMMIKNADKVILLCDNTKEFSNGYFKLANFYEIDMIITNAPFSDELLNTIKNNDCEIIYNQET